VGFGHYFHGQPKAAEKGIGKGERAENNSITVRGPFCRDDPQRNMKEKESTVTRYLLKIRSGNPFELKNL
jgi:hypothetical protein